MPLGPGDEGGTYYLLCYFPSYACKLKRFIFGLTLHFEIEEREEPYLEVCSSSLHINV